MVRHDGASEPVSWRPEHLLEDRYSSHSDTSAIMPNFQRPVIAAGQRYVCHVLEPDSAPRGVWNRVEVEGLHRRSVAADR